MSRALRDYLHHIRDETTFLLAYRATITQDALRQDDLLKRAVVRSIEIIGEAIKHIPDPIRQQYPNIEWRAIAAMRDRLIHAYFGIDYDIIYDVVHTKIPVLHQQIAAILAAEDSAIDDSA